MIAREEVADAVVVERPAVADDAQALKGRPVTCLPVLEQVVEDGVELLLRRVPGLVEVVVDAGGVDGADGRFGVGVGGEQDAPRLGIEIAGPLQQLDAGHARHALVAEEQRHRLLAGLQLGQGVQCGLAAGRRA